jgi:hypothetical protein
MNSAIAAAGAFFIIASVDAEKKKKRRKRMWLRKLFTERTRSNILSVLDEEHFKNFTRLSPEDFEILINSIGPKIQRKDTHLRQAIPVKLRLAITLRFLATGDSYTSLQYVFKVSKQRIGVIVIDTCQALIAALHDNIQVSELCEILFINVKNINT